MQRNQSDWLENLATIVILPLAILVVYGSAINTPFVFDDAITVVENPSIVRLWPLVGHERPGPLNAPMDYPTAGRPLVNLSSALNYKFDLLEPAGYHGVNLALHFISALLVFAIVRRTLRLPYFNGRFESAAGPLALASALLWAVHPLQTEAVNYITQRTELMVGLFYLATMAFSLRYWSATSRFSRGAYLVLATIMCWAGAASKEVMVTAPIVVLLFDRTFVSGSFKRAVEKSWPLYAGLLSSWILLALLNYDGPRANSAGFHLGIPVFGWWFMQAQVLLMYLKLSVWPWPLVIHYQFPLPTTPVEILPALLAVLLLVAGVVVLFWKRWSAGFVGVFVLLVLAPTLIVPITTEGAAERRMYLPLAALVPLAVGNAFELAKRIATRNSAAKKTATTNPMLAAVCTGCVVVLSIVYGAVSAQRLTAYRDPIALFEDAMLYQPHDYMVCRNLGNALLAQKRTEEAINRLRQAQQLVKNFPGSTENTDAAEAHSNLANALLTAEQVPEALKEFEMAVQLKPDFAEAHVNYAAALVKAGRTEEALCHCQTAVGLNPQMLKAHYRWGLTLFSQKNYEEAVRQFEQEVRLNPDFVDAQNYLAMTLCAVGRSQDAVEYLNQVLRLNPKSADAHNNLGTILADTGRSEEGIQHYMAALAIKPDLLQAHTNLMLAYADLNRMNEALAAAEKAIEIARASGQNQKADTIAAWLAAHRTGTENKLPPVPTPEIPLPEQ